MAQYLISKVVNGWLVEQSSPQGSEVYVFRTSESLVLHVRNVICEEPTDKL